MVFSSILFLFLFLPALLACYFAVPRRFLGARNAVLLAFSLVFYACAGLRAVPLILCSILADYVLGLLMDRGWRPRLWLSVGIALHLGLLFWFKYAVFTVTNLNRLGLSLAVPNVVLPIGISFFTFQGMSYLMDVYRHDVPAERSLLRSALYIALFPQLIASPIVRYRDVAREIGTRRESLGEAAEGFARFLTGLAKKVLLSNALAQIADAAFDYQGAARSAALAWLGVIAYAMHVYFDFSGYSDMAIGLGRVFGFHFLENFNYPYISQSITEFWRRWHISLSGWFRDYLYIPLGGSRRGAGRTVLNLFVVWAATGLWHGAEWTFIAWGLYFFALLILEKYLWEKALAKLPRVLRHIYALFFILLGWVLFRAAGLGAAASYLADLFCLGGGPAFEGEVLYLLRRFWPELAAGALACVPVLPWVKARWKEGPGRLVLGRALPLALGFLSVCRLLSSGFNPFIYFRF